LHQYKNKNAALKIQISVYDFQMKNSSQMIAKLLVIVLLVMKLAIPLSAGNYYFKQYQVEDGLSNNNVTCSIQDNYGFI